MLIGSDTLDLPESFAQWLFSCGRKTRTIGLHKRNVETLLKHRVVLSSQKSCKDYIYQMQVRGLSSSHINNFICSIRLLIHFWDEEGVKHDHNLPEWRMMKDKVKMKATMSDEEITAFLALPPKISHATSRWGTPRSWSNVSLKDYHKWTVFFSIMAYSGMRPGEVAALNKKRNVDFGRNVFLLEDTKTNEPRFVPIAPNIKTLVEEYVKSIETDYLFPSKRPEGIVSNVEWHYNFRTRIERMNIVRPNLTPYSLRHSLITRLLEEDVNIFKVQKIVGHHDLRTTAHYTHLTTKDIMAAISKHPVVMRGTEPENIINALEDFMNKLELSRDPRFVYTVHRENGKLEMKIEVVKPPVVGK